MLLQTERCLIRRFMPEDAQTLYLLLSDPTVMEYIEPAYSMEQTRSFLDEAGLSQPPLVYALVWKASNTLVGQIIFHPYDEQSYEIGWLLRQDYWGRGVATEVTLALTVYAASIGASECVIECHPEQAATQRVAEKCGFESIGCHEGLCLYRRFL